MKKRRSPVHSTRHSHEFKGVVKKTAGKLTNDPRLEEEGRQEMLGRRSSRTSAPRKSEPQLNPDPHRRG